MLTCAHVLRGEEVAVDVRATGAPSTAAWPAPTPDLDLAVVAVDTGDAPAGRRGSRPRVGELALGAPVFALADPSGRGLRATFGIVSATGRSLPRPAAGAASAARSSTPRRCRAAPRGGPLVDADGRLLGLNAVRREGGLILAVPADEAVRARVDALARGEAAGRPRLGVALAPPRHARRMRSAVGLPERDGLLVRGVVDGSPAERAGLAARRPARRAPAGAPLDRRRRPVRRARRAPAARSRSASCAAAEERDVDGRARRVATSVREVLR